MSFLQLVRREMHGSLPKLLLMSGLGGISTAAILGAINSGLQNGSTLWAASLFIVALFLFIKTQSYVTITTTAEIEAIIHKIRVRLMDQIRHSELLSIEDVGRARIVAAITSDTAVLTQASNMLAFTVQGAVLIVFVAIYVAFLSIAAILTTIVVVSIAAVIFHQKNRRLVSEKQRAAAWERRLFDRLTDFLDGFKEVRLNSARSTDLFNDAVDVSRTAANIKINTQAETFRMIVTSQISMYVLARRRRVRSPSVQRHTRRSGPDENHDSPDVHRGGVFRSGAVDPHLAECKRVSRPPGTTGKCAAGDGRTAARGSRGEAFRQDRDAQHQFSLRRQVFRGRLQDWPDRFYPACPGSWFSSPAAMARANRPS